LFICEVSAFEFTRLSEPVTSQADTFTAISFVWPLINATSRPSPVVDREAKLIELSSVDDAESHK